MNEDMKNNIVRDYTGTIIKYKKIEAKVVKYDDNEMVLDIMNKKALM